MALFGSDRPVMPTFKTPPDPDKVARSPYDDLNRLERNGGSPDPGDNRNSAELRAKELLQRVVEHIPELNGLANERQPEQILQHEPVRSATPVAAVRPAPRKPIEGTHPLIEGLFAKLPEPEQEWSLPARQKWLQTAANIFDLMYASNETDSGELAIRVERSAVR